MDYPWKASTISGGQWKTYWTQVAYRAGVDALRWIPGVNTAKQLIVGHLVWVVFVLLLLAVNKQQAQENALEASLAVGLSIIAWVAIWSVNLLVAPVKLYAGISEERDALLELVNADPIEVVIGRLDKATVKVADTPVPVTTVLIAARGRLVEGIEQTSLLVFLVNSAARGEFGNDISRMRPGQENLTDHWSFLEGLMLEGLVEHRDRTRSSIVGPHESPSTHYYSERTYMLSDKGKEVVRRLVARSSESAGDTPSVPVR